MDPSLGESAATAPPPPSEVKVRTMRSDLESMAKSGGGLPRSENIKIAGLSAEKQSSSGAARSESHGNLLIIGIVIAALAMLGVGVWFVYTHFFAAAAAPQNQPSPSAPSSAQSQSNQVAVPTTTSALPPPQTAASTPTSPTPFTHVSFFKKPADQILAFNLPAPTAAQNAAELETYNQKLLNLLATAKKSANFLEIDVKAADGHALSINELLAQQNAQVLDAQLLASDFNPDATFFAYRDKNGFWPGYIIGLNQSQNWLFIKNDIQKIESSPSIANFFLTDAGKASADGFRDGVISSTSVRILPFAGNNGPAYFVYGWTPDHQYLIFSTSQAGFAEAVGKL